MGDKIISLNSQGFYNGDVNDLVSHHKPLAFSLSEHKQTDLRKLDCIDGYRLANGVSSQQRGTAVFVKNGVDYKVRRDLDSFSRAGKFEASSVEIPSKNVVVTGLYRSPNSSKTSFNSSLGRFSEKINGESHKNHVIAGDFNIDSRRNSGTRQLLRDNDLKFNLRSATHEKGRCLDNFVTDFQPGKTRVMRAKSDQISDHSPIEMRLPARGSSSRAKNDEVWGYRQPARSSRSKK